jgi:hypothetical protein
LLDHCERAVWGDCRHWGRQERPLIPCSARGGRFGFLEVARWHEADVGHAGAHNLSVMEAEPHVEEQLVLVRGHVGQGPRRSGQE